MHKSKRQLGSNINSLVNDDNEVKSYDTSLFTCDTFFERILIDTSFNNF